MVACSCWLPVSPEGRSSVSQETQAGDMGHRAERLLLTWKLTVCRGNSILFSAVDFWPLLNSTRVWAPLQQLPAETALSYLGAADGCYLRLSPTLQSRPHVGGILQFILRGPWHPEVSFFLRNWEWNSKSSLARALRIQYVTFLH